MVCGNCGPQLGPQCPVCRAPCSGSATETVARIRVLLGGDGRDPGRHTAVAQHILGFMLKHGRGAPKDSVEAALFYHLAADAGRRCAQDSYGYMLETGEGVSVDIAEACRYYKLAADQGLARAQYNLGYMYEHGDGVPNDAVEAYRLYCLAAEQTYAAAQDAVGKFFTLAH